MLVRHGETTWNAAGRVQGHNDRSSLTPAGLARSFRGTPVGALWSSDLSRARATAEPLAAELGLVARVRRGLRERSFGEVEGRPATSLTPELTGVEARPVVDPDARPAGGESIRRFAEGVGRALAEIATELANSSAPPVAHGGTIRVAAAALSGLPLAGLGFAPVENAAVVRASFRPTAGRRASLGPPEA